jgi:hypothetical protein
LCSRCQQTSAPNFVDLNALAFRRGVGRVFLWATSPVERRGPMPIARAGATGDEVGAMIRVVRDPLYRVFFLLPLVVNFGNGAVFPFLSLWAAQVLGRIRPASACCSPCRQPSA